MEVGPYTVVVTEVPGASLSKHERRDIDLTRQSYRTMWGGTEAEVAHGTEEDLDGDDGAQVAYNTRHYLAWVRDRGLDSVKLVTARRVNLQPGALNDEGDPGQMLPPDIAFWRVHTPDGAAGPLWDWISAFARRLDPQEERVALRVACMGKLAAFPVGQRERSPRQRERTAVAWAAIQVLATLGDSNLLYVLTIRPELVSTVLTAGGVGMAFTSSEETLGLPPDSVFVSNVLAWRHKVGRPGYWVHSGDAADALFGLLEQGRLTVAELRRAMGRLIEVESAIGGTGRELEELIALWREPDHRQLADLLTRPRMFKHLIPLLRGDERLSRISCGQLRACLLFATKNAPYSCTVLPGPWAASAQALLEATASRYTGWPGD